MIILTSYLGLALLCLLGTVSSGEHCCDSVANAVECKMVDVCRDHVWSRPDHADLVQINGYLESECIGCKYWVTETLDPTYKKVTSIMNVKLFYFGNAKESRDGDKWKFSCQHGPEECRGNLLITCAIHLYPDIKQWLPLTVCVESKDMAFDPAFQTCANASHLDYNKIKSCASSSEGNKLEHEVAVATNSLHPPHKYTPWITVNGKNSSLADTRLLEVVCDNYKGKKPPACLNLYRKKEMRWMPRSSLGRFLTGFSL